METYLFIVSIVLIAIIILLLIFYRKRRIWHKSANPGYSYTCLASWEEEYRENGQDQRVFITNKHFVTMAISPLEYFRGKVEYHIYEIPLHWANNFPIGKSWTIKKEKHPNGKTMITYIAAVGTDVKTYKRTIFSPDENLYFIEDKI